MPRSNPMYIPTSDDKPPLASSVISLHMPVTLPDETTHDTHATFDDVLYPSIVSPYVMSSTNGRSQVRDELALFELKKAFKENRSLECINHLFKEAGGSIVFNESNSQGFIWARIKELG